MSRPIKIILSLAIPVGVIAMLLFSSMAEAEFYKHVHELTPELDQWAGKSLRVHGFVEAGSIKEDIVDQKATRTFYLEFEGERLQIYHEGPKPDTFRDLAEVVAKGRLVKENNGYVFHATELMAKCPSKYEENKRSRPSQGNLFVTDEP